MARGFRLIFNTVNQLIDVVRSQRPAITTNSFLEQTATGTTRRPVAGASKTSDEGGTARWA